MFAALLLLLSTTANANEIVLRVKEEQSATPWMNGVAVTNAHIGRNISGEICNSVSHDLKFYNTNESSGAHWRNPVVGEAVTLVGFVKVYRAGNALRRKQSMRSSTSRGTVLGQGQLTWQGETTNLFWVATGEAKQGMSGGPVVAEDGNLVGIIMGKVDTDSLRKTFGNRRYVVFIPYQTIQLAWQSCS